MKFYRIYDPLAGHTYPLTVDGEQFWADWHQAMELAYRVKPQNVVMLSDVEHNFRGVAIHLYHGDFYTVTTDGTCAMKVIERGWVAFDRMVRQYDADPRWTRMAEVQEVA